MIDIAISTLIMLIIVIAFLIYIFDGKRNGS
jgi:hypothetical protein